MREAGEGRQGVGGRREAGHRVWPGLFRALWDLAAVIFKGQRMILKAVASDSPPGGGTAISAKSWDWPRRPGLGRSAGSMSESIRSGLGWCWQVASG